MSLKNRKQMYDQLVLAGKLSQDDGALILEFGEDTTDLSYSDMTKAVLKAELDKLKIVYTTSMTKDDLVVLLENKSDEPVEEPEGD